MTKVIFFDLGEVIFTNDWHYECPEKFAAFEEFYGINYDQMEEGWNVAWPLYELGKISEDEFWEIFLENAGAKNTAGTNITNIKQAKFLWKKYFGYKKGMFEILEKLKKKYTLAVYSSTGKEWLDYKIKTYNLDKYFSAYITTCNMHMKKTKPEAFENAFRELNVQPEESLFVDDSEKVVHSAQDAGAQAILFTTPIVFAEELKTKSLL